MSGGPPERSRSRSRSRENAPGDYRETETARYAPEPEQADEDPPQMYIGNLDYKLNREDIVDFFDREHGVKIESVQIKFDRETRTSRGFGFVSFYSAADRDAAVERGNGSVRFPCLALVSHVSPFPTPPFPSSAPIHRTALPSP